VAVAAAIPVAFVVVDMIDMIDMAYFAESVAPEGKILVVAERSEMAFAAELEIAA
jgi:hypothetical protein